MHFNPDNKVVLNFYVHEVGLDPKYCDATKDVMVDCSAYLEIKNIQPYLIKDIIEEVAFRLEKEKKETWWIMEAHLEQEGVWRIDALEQIPDKLENDWMRLH